MSTKELAKQAKYLTELGIFGSDDRTVVGILREGGCVPKAKDWYCFYQPGAGKLSYPAGQSMEQEKPSRVKQMDSQL